MNSSSVPQAQDPIIIDFDQPFDKKLLIALLRENPNTMLAALTEYDVVHLDTKQRIAIQLNQHLIINQIDNETLEVYVMGDLVGEGSYGDVFDLRNRFILKKDDTFVPVTCSTPQVAKLQKHNKEYPSKRAFDEYEIIAIAGHLGIEKPIIIQKKAVTDYVGLDEPIKLDKSGKIFSLTIMDKVNGKSLKKLIKENCMTKETHSYHVFRNDIVQALQLSLSIAEALKSLHDKGILHRDLKPGNIIVDEVNHQWLSSIIDFGLSRKRGAKDYRSPGSPGFFAPEVIYDKKTTRKSDVFSFGIIFAILMGARNPADDFKATHKPFQHIEKIKNGYKMSSGLFASSKQEINPLHEKIIALIDLSTNKDREKRPFMSQIISELSDMINASKSENIGSVLQKN